MQCLFHTNFVTGEYDKSTRLISRRIPKLIRLTENTRLLGLNPKAVYGLLVALRTR